MILICNKHSGDLILSHDYKSGRPNNLSLKLVLKKTKPWEKILGADNTSRQTVKLESLWGFGRFPEVGDGWCCLRHPFKWFEVYLLNSSMFRSHTRIKSMMIIKMGVWTSMRLWVQLCHSMWCQQAMIFQIEFQWLSLDFRLAWGELQPEGCCVTSNTELLALCQCATSSWDGDSMCGMSIPGPTWKWMLHETVRCPTENCLVPIFP